MLVTEFQSPASPVVTCGERDQPGAVEIQIEIVYRANFTPAIPEGAFADVQVESGYASAPVKSILFYSRSVPFCGRRNTPCNHQRHTCCHAKYVSQSVHPLIANM